MKKYDKNGKVDKGFEHYWCYIGISYSFSM